MYEILTIIRDLSIPAIITVIIIYFLLSNKITNLERRVERLENRFSEISRGLLNYNIAIIDLLSSKGIVTRDEVLILKKFISTILTSSSGKYFTSEARAKLKKIIDKNLEDYTWEDLYEIEKIAELIRKEFYEVGDEKLIDLYWKLMMFIAMVRGLLRSGKLRQ